MKIRTTAGEHRPSRTRTIMLSAAFSITLVAAVSLAPAVASAQAPSSDPYSSTSTNPSSETAETTDTESSDSGTTETETSDTGTAETETSETGTTETATSETETSETETSETETSETETSETETSETETSETETTETETTETETTETETTETSSTPSSATTPAELAVFDPGPCSGAFVTASGSGFTPGETIDLQRDGVSIATVTAGADGSFAVRVDIAGVQNGEHAITATGTVSLFTATGVFAVVAQVCTSGSGTTAVVIVGSGSQAAVVVVAKGATPLATTGFPAASAFAVALLALVVGSTLLIATRHRRSARASVGISEDQAPRHL